ncbi:MAG TPA: hypothetical protein VK724_24020 [Bryobacteraceae bacterium]|nr:hypothetical protein [Bryobacteraceae bacterium]
MRCALARVAILLSIALALANAECFTRCLAQPVDHAAPPCHSHSKTQLETPQQQHDAQPSASFTLAPAVAVAAIPVSSLGEPLPASRDDQPQLNYDTGPLPLRI